MRYLRIFLLHLQYVFAHPSKTFVYFLIALVNPLATMIFWIAAIASNQGIGVTASSIISYYFLLIIFGALLITHHERDVGEEDIHRGQLTQYLLKPFSYFWFNFLKELPYRVLQGFLGVMVFIIFFSFFSRFLEISSKPQILIGALIISILAYALSFVLKMVIGILAFWTTDTGGIFNLTEIMMLVFAGYIMPLSLMPAWIERVAYFLPFSYILYFPVISFQGKLELIEILRIILTQGAWILALALIYQFLWKRGIRKFTAIGQ